MKIEQAKSENDILELIDENLLKKIPEDKISMIAKNILDVEKYFRGELHLRPEDILATRIYSLTLQKITQIYFEGKTYKI
ncbi:hypothetical protein [Algoriphagus marinus]|uniref:hypothetical protein n=1 Tax=Algoriphagus marinus TaxID=1925762 RepID=UPI00094B8931|nr:hypothetical protein [Algoriphagus marinus]